MEEKKNGIFDFITQLFNGADGAGNGGFDLGSFFQSIMSFFGLGSKDEAPKVSNTQNKIKASVVAESTRDSAPERDPPKIRQDFETVRGIGQQQALLIPELVEAMQHKENVRELVNYTLEEVERYNETHSTKLNAHMMVNQFFAESSFDPKANSGHALGIAQFTPETGAKYGLKNAEDFINPYKSISAGIAHMGDLTKQYGDQTLALVNYNGGPKAIAYAERELGKSDIDIHDWMGFMGTMRETHGVKGAENADKWRVATYNYVQKINPEFWNQKQILTAQAQQNTSEDMTSEMRLAQARQTAADITGTGEDNKLGYDLRYSATLGT